MLKSPRFVKNIFSEEASARDGRFTRRCLPLARVDWPAMRQDIGVPLNSDVCEFGMVLLSTHAAAQLTWQDWWSHQFEADKREAELDAAANDDDVIAWAFAARWWLNFAREWHQEVLKNKAKTGIDISSPRLQPNRLYWFGEAGDPVDGYLGGQDFLASTEGDAMMLLTSSWPLYFNSLGAQIVLKALQRKVSALVKIQIVLRFIGRNMGAMADAASDHDLNKLRTQDGAVSLT